MKRTSLLGCASFVEDDALALLSSSISHELLAQPKKYGTITATVLPAWDINEMADCPHPDCIHSKFWWCSSVYKTHLCTSVSMHICWKGLCWVHQSGISSVHWRSSQLCVKGWNEIKASGSQQKMVVPSYMLGVSHYCTQSSRGAAIDWHSRHHWFQK